MQEDKSFAEVISWVRHPYGVEIIVPTRKDFAEMQTGLSVRGLLCQTEAEFNESGGPCMQTRTGLIRSTANFQRELLTLCVNRAKKQREIPGVMEFTRLHRIEAGLVVEIRLDDAAAKAFDEAGATIWLGGAGHVKFIDRNRLHQVTAAREARILALRQEQQEAAERYAKAQKALQESIEEEISATLNKLGDILLERKDGEDTVMDAEVSPEELEKRASELLGDDQPADHDNQDDPEGGTTESPDDL